MCQPVSPVGVLDVIEYVTHLNRDHPDLAGKVGPKDILLSSR